MGKYRIIEPTNEIKFKELAIISHNLRYYTKIWKVNFGVANKENMILWEQKMDSWLQNNVDYTDNSDLEAQIGMGNLKWAGSSQNGK